MSFFHRVYERSIYNFKEPQRHTHDKSFAKDIKTRAETQKLFEVRAMYNRKFSIVCERHVASVKHINYVCGPINPK